MCLSKIYAIFKLTLNKQNVSSNINFLIYRVHFYMSGTCKNNYSRFLSS